MELQRNHHFLQEAFMELQIARQIIDTLAQGIHPVTGEAMPDDSPYNAPPVIRALHTVARALEGEPPAAEERSRRVPNAGKPWTAADDSALETAFDAGIPVKQVAQELGRTAFAVEQRLIKIGKVAAPAGGGRFPAPASAN
jgi:hypothetical protein